MSRRTRLEEREERSARRRSSNDTWLSADGSIKMVRRELRDEQGLLCNKCGGPPSEFPHTCPFQSEIYGCSAASCNCCENCGQDCAHDV